MDDFISFYQPMLDIDIYIIFSLQSQSVSLNIYFIYFI